MLSPSWIEISESALRHNLRFLRSWIGPAATFSSVVKGNAYGHGIETYVPLAEKCGVRHFSVFSADEAERVLASTTKDSEIMIMGAIDDDELEWAVEKGISFYVFDLGRLEAARRAAEKAGGPAKIHIELETGLNRTGLREAELARAVSTLMGDADRFIVEGLCTHYAGAESIGNHFRIMNQIQRFAELSARLEGEGIHARRRHTACSAAALNYPDTIMDMVRFGIAQYGFWPTQETRMHYFIQHSPDSNHRTTQLLKPVMSWKSRVMAIQDVAAGEFVGYGMSYQATRRQRIASVPVGYYHGFARNLSNLGHVLVRGRRALVVGTVAMNMMMVDVTDVPGIQKGDEVVIIGKQKRTNISVASFSDMAKNLNYEVLVSLSCHIPRMVVA
jgi:alanine racemase